MNVSYPNTPSQEAFHRIHGKGASYAGELPAQVIPSSKKNKAWLKRTLDALEEIGVAQFHENLKFNDIYRMCDGEMSYMELSEVIPQLKGMDVYISKHLTVDSLPDCDSWLKHYDIIGVVINAIVGWYTQYEDQWTVTSSDDFETNALIREKTNLITNHIREEFDRELKVRLAEKGINPDPTGQNFQTPQEQQQYIDQVRQVKFEMTPPAIQTYLSTEFSTATVKWGNHTLKNDRRRFQMDEMDAENFADYLKTGRCFRNHRIGSDSYEPEVWSARNVFFAKSPDTKNIEDGPYAGRVHYYLASAFVDKYADELTDIQKVKILGGYRAEHSAGGSASSNLMPWREELLPRRDFYDYKYATDIQEATGMPMGTFHPFNDPGGKGKSTFLPVMGRFGSYSNGGRAATLRDDIVINNSEVIQVTEAYWVSWQRVYYITWQQPDGLVVQDIVTDELLSDFLTENHITKENLCPRKYLDDPTPNTYITDWKKEVRFGVKACTSSTALGEDVYLFGEPLERQIKGESNSYKVRLPLSGIAGHSVAKKLYPFQVLYNLAMNQMCNYMEKEIGIFAALDIQFVPAKMKKDNDEIDDFLSNVISVAKSIGVLGIDAGRQNVMQQGGPSSMDQIQRIDLSNTQMIKSRIDVSEYIYNKALSLIGLTPQALGTPVNYQTSTGVKQGLQSSLVQLQTYFDTFDRFKQRDWNIHLAIAQFCQKTGRDITVMYTANDLTRAFLSFSDPDISLRQLDIFPDTNSKNRQNLESLKQYLVQDNTRGFDIRTLAELWTSESMNELKSIAYEARKYQEEQAEKQRQHDREQQQAALDAEERIDIREHDQRIQEVNLKGQYGLQEKIIEAYGRAADNNTTPEGLQALNNAEDRMLKASEGEENRSLEREKIKQQDEQNKRMERFKIAEQDLKKAQLLARKYEIDKKLEIARTNFKQ